MITALAAAVTMAAPPNIVFIVADDLGYGSLGCYGETEIPTPHIDGLAAEGARYTDAYVTAPVCGPSRAGFLSGRYQQRFGFEHNIPGGRGVDPVGFPLNQTNLGEALDSAGYRTGLIGKWHQGSGESHVPNARGFDRFFGFLSGGMPYFPGRRSRLLSDGQSVTETAYSTDAFEREALAFLNQKDDRPFFLFLSFNAVHTPLEATEEDLAVFGHLEGDRRTYAAMQHSMDQAVGSVLATLESQGMEDETLVVFMSDNGGPTAQTTSSNGPLNGGKGQVYEGGVRIPLIVRWPGQVPAGATVSDPVISLDLYPTFLQAAGATTPAELDGRSLLAEPAGERTFCWRMGNKKAIRHGDWKAVHQRRTWELYNLATDLGEQTNLAEEMPEKLMEMLGRYDEWNEANVDAAWIDRES